MKKVLSRLVGFGIPIYLDDGLLYVEDPEELIEILRKVLKLLINGRLKCNAKKCHLFAKEKHYLGQVVSRDGLKPELAKIDKIEQWPRPDTGTNLASFLALCNYYRTLVPSFAHVSDLLYKASKMKVIKWTADLSTKFDELKALMLSAPVVLLPDVDREFMLKTDGSKVALGAVLKLRFDDTALVHPVGFISRALSGSERKHAAYELEMYAVVRAVEHFRMFLLGREFLLLTDHATLAKLLRRDLPPITRDERWILRLFEYSFRIQHQRGIDNVMVDVLSRLPFARSTVQKSKSSLSMNTSNGKINSTGSFSAGIQPDSS